MPRGIRKKEGENLSEANIAKVIEALESDTPITKVIACEILNISYNTTRLNKIIQDYKDTMEHRAKMRKKMRTIPMDIPTASDIVSSYLSGESLSEISDKTYRSTAIIKKVLTDYNVPIRNAAVTYFKPIDLEPEMWDYDYVVGDLVYSARYDEPATIKAYRQDETHGHIYKIWLHKSAKIAFQPYYELADLRKIQTELNIKMKDMEAHEIQYLINEGLKNQKKQEDKRK